MGRTKNLAHFCLKSHVRVTSQLHLTAESYCYLHFFRGKREVQRGNLFAFNPWFRAALS